VQSYLALAEAAGCPPEPPRLELATTADEESQADAAWQALGLRSDGRVIALNSSGAYGAAKLWPVEHFAALARQIAENDDHDVLVVCGPQERDIGRAIAVAAAHPRVVSLADQPLGLGLTKACLRRCRLTVSSDSGPRHVAAAFGRPVVTLLGPTTPIWIENPLVRAVNLQLPLDCAGCYARKCPLGHHRCMRDLTPEMVHAAVAQLLADEAALAA
jgi:heptosyltransferase-2